jgi:hypothetical protein
VGLTLEGSSSSHKHSHTAADDLMASDRTFRFNDVCLKGGVVEECSPDAKRHAASDDLVAQACRLNLEAFREVGFSDRAPVHWSRQTGIF